MNITGPYLLQVNNGSGNGLVPSGNKAEAITWANVDPDLCRHIASLGHNELSHHLTDDQSAMVQIITTDKEPTSKCCPVWLLNGASGNI